MRSAPWLLSFLALTSCGIGGLRDRYEDNGSVRARQKASIDQYGERPIAGQDIGGFFKDKVGLIEVEGGTIPVGRAAPLTADGYYLTALHVVANADFRLTISTFSANRLRTRAFPGRIVWRDPSADLAIVKFEFRPPFSFGIRKSSLQKGGAVFSGAYGFNGGRLVVPPKANGTFDLGDVRKSGTGNGPFQTAGKVTSFQVIEGESSWTIYQSTLVGRRGMSGGPVVNRKGRLVGIITSIHERLLSSPTTSFSMMDPKALDEIIQRDRRRH